MADHFEEIVHLRLGALETRVDDEAQAVKEHFLEQQKFITESLNNQATRLREDFRADLRAEIGNVRADLLTEIGGVRADLRAELRAEIGNVRADLHAEIGGVRADLRAEAGSLRAEIGDLRADVGRLDQRLGAFQDANRREHALLEQMMDARFDAVHLVLREILGRLPPPA